MSENDGIVDEFTFCIGGNTIFKVAMDLIVTMATIYIYIYVAIFLEVVLYA